MSIPERIAPCEEEDACELTRVEVDFAIPIFMTQDQQRRLLDLLDEIVKAPCNQLAEGVHWIAGVGSKPQWSKADALLLGKGAAPDAPDSGEPTFDNEVFHVETCAREFVNESERNRVMGQRARLKKGGLHE